MTVGLAPRVAALAAVTAVDAGAWSTTAVPEAIGDLADERDRALAAHLAHGTIRWRGTLDWTLQQVLTRPLADVEASLARILRLGAFQLRHSRVPSRAAVDTAVALARRAVPRSRAKGAGGFVNGVLRGLSRRGDEVDARLARLDDVPRIAVQTGHPEWIVVERLADGLDVDQVAALLGADNDPPGLTLRAVDDRDALVAELAEVGIDAHPTRRAAHGVRAPGADPRRLACVAEGRAVPQDEASMLVTEAAHVRPGDRVLDLCAGPGGKTTDLARRAGRDGHVTAIELHGHRADLVRAAADRVGVTVDVRVGDSRHLDLPGDADVVLVDAPCTGLGVGRRRPEVRWRRGPDDAADLADLQRQLVERGLSSVRDGGHLTYAACTWTTTETTAVVDAVEATSRRRLERLEAVQLTPDQHDTDGMFHVTWRVGA